jgi:hypothetical protein
MRKKEAEHPQETPPFEDDLRSDLIPGSQAVPDHTLFRERLAVLTPARFISLILVLVLLIIGWILFAGPGKSATEKFLTNLSARESTPTIPPLVLAEEISENTSTPIPINPTEKTSLPSKSPTLVIPSITPVLPSETTTTSAISSPTSLPSTSTLPPSFTPTLSPTATSTATMFPTASIAGCVQAAVITTADVGKTLCVTGQVLRTESKTNSFLIILENPKEAFYFLSYDRKWELKEGVCVYATGKIMQLGNNPVMILDYKIPLEYCP